MFLLMMLASLLHEPGGCRSMVLQVTSAHIVYDPFVGTASVLVAARKLTNCIVMGADIDMRILRVSKGWGIRDLQALLLMVGKDMRLREHEVQREPFISPHV